MNISKSKLQNIFIIMVFGIDISTKIFFCQVFFMEVAVMDKKTHLLYVRKMSFFARRYRSVIQ